MSDDLRALAEAAKDDDGSDPYEEAQRAFANAASPDAILALIAERDELKAENWKLTKRVAYMAQGQTNLAAARARIEAARDAKQDKADRMREYYPDLRRDFLCQRDGMIECLALLDPPEAT